MKESVDIKHQEKTNSNNVVVLAEQTLQMYIAVKNAIIATVINSLILVVVLWQVVEHKLLITWLVSILFVSLLRSLNTYLYQKASPSPNEAHIWAQRFLIGSITGSVIWGASSIWIFPANDIAHQAFLAFVIGGMAAAAITSLSYLKLAIYIYLTFSLIPLMIRFYSGGTDLSLAMGTMIALFYIILMLSAKQAHIKSNQNISMRIDNIEQQRSLNESEHRYKTLLDTATDAFFLHDLNGKIIDVNKQACLSLGYTKDELLALSVSDIDVDTGKPGIKWNKLKEGENISIESMHRRKDGSTFPVEVGIGYIHMGDEPLVSVLVRDITERKRIEKMKNEFVSTVSHELRTPLTSIRGGLGLLAGGAVGELPPQAQEIISVANRNAESLLLLVNDILDMQKIETGELEMDFEMLEVIPFLHQAIEGNKAYADQFSVAIVLKPYDEEVFLRANKDRLMQVMANLISNAVKFSNENGVIEVSVSKPEDNVVRISVTDHGLGIAKEFYPTIFDKFTQQDSSDTRQKGGTGLGLSISEAIIENHGGEISFTSSVGEGSTFYFDLPELIVDKK